MSAMPFGFYGKLPSQGDFVGRRLPWEFNKAWDQWMQEGVRTAREQLGAGWLRAYLSAPVWRFRLGPGLIGDTGWVGLWFASVDRVGRHFPLVVASPCSAGAAALVHAPDEAWQQLEDQALTALDPRLSLAQFDATVMALAAPAANSTSAAPAANTTSAAPATDATPTAAADVGLRLQLLPVGASPQAVAQACANVDGAAAVFFSWGSDTVPVTVLSAAELVAADAFSGFLTGQWPAAWADVGQPATPPPTN